VDRTFFRSLYKNF